MSKIIVHRDPAKINLAVLDLHAQVGDLAQLPTIAADVNQKAALVSEATGQAVAAAGTAAAAELAAVAAQGAAVAAASRAVAAQNLYADVTTGLAATSAGDQFMVDDGDDYIRYLHDPDNEAVELGRTPSGQRIITAEAVVVPAAEKVALDRGVAEIAAHQAGVDAGRAEAAAADAVNNAPWNVKDYETFAALEEVAVGARYRAPGMAWDVVPKGTSGSFDHPRADAGFFVVSVGGRCVDRAYGLTGSGDETALLQKALNAATVAKAEFYQDTKIYISTVGITTPANARWIYGPSGELELLPHNAGTYQMIRVYEGANDVYLHKPKCNGRRDLNSATTGEWGMGISLRACERVTIYEPQADSCWGDGIYVGSNGLAVSASGYKVNKDVTIIRPRGDNNRRQSISIICGENLLIESPEVSDTNGAAPMDGIDIEPNNYKDVLKNVRILNVKSHGNQSAAVQFHMGPTEPPVGEPDYEIDVVIDNLSSKGDGAGIVFTGLKHQRIQGRILVRNPSLEDTVSTCVSVRNWCYVPDLHVVIERPNIIRPNREGGSSARWNSAITVMADETWDSVYDLGGITVIEPAVSEGGTLPAFVNVQDYGRETFSRGYPKAVNILDPRSLDGVTVAAMGGLQKTTKGVLTDKYGVWVGTTTAGTNSLPAVSGAPNLKTSGSNNITFNLVSSPEWPRPKQSIEVGGTGWVRIVPPSGGKFVGYPVDRYLQSTSGVGARIVIQQIGDLLWNIAEASPGFKSVDEIALSVTSAIAANIASASHQINTAGKSAGRQLFDTTNSRVMTATGAMPNSPWVSFDGSVVVTPA